MRFAQFCEVFNWKPKIDDEQHFEGGQEHTYEFKTHHGTHTVDIFHSKKTAHVSFVTHPHDDDGDVWGSTGVTGNHGPEAAKVFGGVHHVIRQHLARHPHVDSLKFNADASEPTRVKLYHHIARRFDPDYTHAGDQSGQAIHFHMKVNQNA